MVRATGSMYERFAAEPKVSVATLDHDWIAELGEQLPAYRPPLNIRRIFGDAQLGEDGRLEVTVRF